MNGSNIAFQISEPDGDSEIAEFILRRRGAFFPDSSIIADMKTAPDTHIGVLLSTKCPIFDEVLITEMVKASQETGHTYKSVDAIPGTEPIVVSPTCYKSDVREFFWTTQHKYSTNFNIGRPNRRRIFDALRRKLENLESWPLTKIIEYLESDDGVDLVVAYGEDVKLEKFHRCPFCDGTSQPLYSGTSNPLTGFLTKNVSVYSHCLSCGLTFLSRQMQKAELWRYYQEHSYGNPRSTEDVEHLLQNLSENNVSHYANYVAVLKYLEGVQAGQKIGDLGAGRGEFVTLAKLANPQAEVSAYDWRFNEHVCAALEKRDIKPVPGNFQKLDFANFQILSAWEVIEHLKVADIEPFLANIRAALDAGGYFIFSTPDFDNRYARALDFWATAPGEHITVLSRRFLEPLLERAGLKIVEEMHECVTLKLPGTWFAFGAATDVHFSSKAASSMIEDSLQDDLLRESIRQSARQRNMGSELILVCQAN